MEYWFNKYKEVVSDNEKLRASMKYQLDKINEQRGKLTQFEHSFDDTLTKLEHEKKENERLKETIDTLHDEINKLKGDTDDSD